MNSVSDAFNAVLAAYRQHEPSAKCRQLAGLDASALAPLLAAGTGRLEMPVPGRPERPLLVHPREVPTRGLGTVAGRVALIHAVAHIEFNAINLALDAALRFSGLPAAYYADWLSVAQDEARHFVLLQTRLRQLGADYGDCTAHNGLWEAAEKTAHDPLVRMALVPRVLEARGLDVTPGMIRRLREVGDHETVVCLEVILAEEVGHVEKGTRWFRHLCAQRGLEPVATFRRLLGEHGAQLRPPFNEAARAQAGFVAEELVPTQA